MFAQQPEVERLLVVINPASTNFKQVNHDVIDRLDDSHWRNKYETFVTEDPRNGANNSARIGERLLPHTALVVPAGDGSIGEAASGMDQTEDEVRNTGFLLPLPYGSGNDTVRSIHGRVRNINVLDVLNRGVEFPLDLLQIKTDEKHRTGVGSASMGWTADGTMKIGEPDKREAKKTSIIPDKLLDANTLARLALKERFPAFKYSEGMEPNREASEMLFSNLPYMAGGVVKIEESRPGKMVCIEIGPEKFTTNVLKRFATERFLGGFRGTHLATRTIELETDANLNVDGEGSALAAGTIVSFAVKADRVRAIALPKRHHLSLA